MYVCCYVNEVAVLLSLSKQFSSIPDNLNSFLFSFVTVFQTLTHSVVVLALRKVIFHAFVLKQKVEPKIQAHSMRISHLCGKSFGEWAIGPPRTSTARAARRCLEHFHRMAVSRWRLMSTALNFSWEKA